ncbi:MAG TPA: hypothetical protein VGK24_14825 [Candidatus Angelobacter sp.]|jgi:hypothetical protein
MKKEEIVKAIRGCAKELGRNPNLREMREIAGVPIKTVYKQLGGVAPALKAAGLTPMGPGFSLTETELLMDWGAVTRKLKKVPSAWEYERQGRFTPKPFYTRFDNWMGVPKAFCKFMGKPKNQSLKQQWRDVLKLIATKPAVVVPVWPSAVRPSRRRTLPDRPVYGSPMQLAEMAHAPTNEMGVLFMFGVMARRLGFIVHRLQPGFPDCIAMREIAPGRWQRVRIEFEFESRSFFKHRHRADRCDVIVCWKHNWKECPKGLEVVELGKEVEKELEKELENLHR